MPFRSSLACKRVSLQSSAIKKAKKEVWFMAIFHTPPLPYCSQCNAVGLWLHVGTASFIMALHFYVDGIHFTTQSSV